MIKENLFLFKNPNHQSTQPPIQCTRPNELFGTASPCDACPWVKDPTRACVRSLIVGCVCKSGYVRRTESFNSECIARENC
ncbi:hypothetical protein B4U79_18583 [Dinothrombium tinctorium]|uniref:Uncharacterized protein n=1 Tax=Dinothrombium tinctorium TaxID=1965070 RepID=A0A3S3RGJ8_9ACAR|nr:hypothetical protein B4U79_18660 [Dinothrombium tinctorium]RWS01183.1 hypothetical protein B4U79_18591 [Dinothrombium tinctorium]RWS01251.1 hypothetical protein B4U79_18583 [Dinothrombium tinctorium]